jgi:hypothetical protein
MMSAEELPAVTNNIVPARESVGSKYHAVQTLRMLGVERIAERQIIEWHDSLGSYGMGGPGFFGLRLAASGAFPEEWLVLTLWGADNWLLFDGRWVAAHPNQYGTQRPLVSNFAGEEQWDEFSEQVVGASIEGANITDSTSSITLEKDSITHILEIPTDGSRLPLYGGSRALHAWLPSESFLDAWVISQSGDLLV